MAKNRLIASSWDQEGVLWIDTVDATLNTEPCDRPSIAHSVDRCPGPGVAVMWRPRQSVRSKIFCRILLSLSLNCLSPGAHTFISCIPLRPPSVLPNVLSWGFPKFSSRNRSCCGSEGRNAGDNDSRVRVRTSRIPLSHSSLAARITLCWDPPRVCH